MFRYAKWWAAAFLATLAVMALFDQLTKPDSVDPPEAVAARGFDNDGMQLVIEPESEDSDAEQGKHADGVDNSRDVAARTASGVPAANSGRNAVGIVVEPAAFSLVATANSSTVIARTAPSADADVLGEFANPIPSGAPLVFQVERSGTTSSADWVEVKLPIRPNGTTGWVPRADVDLVDNPFRVEIDRRTFLLRVYEQNKMIVETTIAIGTGDTPTPVGDFYLTELLAPPDPTGIYGPFAFGLSGFSETLATFGGADVAVIGLHGTNDPLSLGTNISYGCVRIANDVITRLAETLPLGTPVQII